MVESEERLSKLLLVLQQVFIKVGVHRTPTGKEWELTNRQVGILGTLMANDSLTMSELAERIYIVQSAATRMINGMVSKGLLKRVPDSTDRRIIRIRITGKGEQVYNSVCNESSISLSIMLDHMKLADQEALIRGLEAFIEAYQEMKNPFPSDCENGDCDNCDQKCE